MEKNFKLSVAIATFNEEENIRTCIESIQGIYDELVVVDGSSTDQTVKIAKSLGAKVYVIDNPPIFHINKQKAIEKTGGEWILQLDADERVSQKLAKEIQFIVRAPEQEIERYQQNLAHKELFFRHQQLIEKRDGKIGLNHGEYVAFFIPRLNFFLGKYLRFGGVYPDGVIRLIKRQKAYLPAKNVHEQFIVKGKVGWLQNDLLHIADPSLKRYLMRNKRYVSLLATELKEQRVGKNIMQYINYMFVKPIWWFVLTQIRHKGILDGFQGIIFSFFSALRYPRAYLQYLKSENLCV